MISLRAYVQRHMDAVYAAAFGAGAGPSVPLSEVLKTAHLAARALGYGNPFADKRLVDVSDIQLPDFISARALFAHVASYYVSQGVDVSYICPDIPPGSVTKYVPSSMILPPSAELTYLLSLPLVWVPIDLPKLEAS